MKHKIMKTLLIVFSLVFIFSCKTSQESTPPGNNPPPDGNTISIRDNSFSPALLTVDPGTTVRWVHNASAIHTATSGTRNNPDGIFNSGDMRNGDTFEFTFTDSGTFDYNCIYHAGMDGTIVVR
jgi:plastocyanin